MNALRLLDELAEEIRHCPKCRLCETRTHAVPGEGSAQAQLMFVGEGPGENEDKTGRPFVGAAGQFLDQLLQQAGIARDDVFITNIVKCRPPHNRVPHEDEVAACRDYLDAQIAIIQPKFVCPLGGSALKRLLGPQWKITQVHCRVFRKSGILFIPLFHPAAALHRQELQATLRADILQLQELISREIRAEEITEIPTRSACESIESTLNETAAPDAAPNLALF